MNVRDLNGRDFSDYMRKRRGQAINPILQKETTLSSHTWWSCVRIRDDHPWMINFDRDAIADAIGIIKNECTSLFRDDSHREGSYIFIINGIEDEPRADLLLARLVDLVVASWEEPR